MLTALFPTRHSMQCRLLPGNHSPVFLEARRAYMGLLKDGKWLTKIKATVAL